MLKKRLLMRGGGRKCWKTLDIFNIFEHERNSMGTQHLLMRECWWKCWKAFNTFKTIEHTKKYYGNARCINEGRWAEMLESIDHL